MKILVNGAWLELRARELGSALEELGYGEAVVTTAVNGEFVAAASRPQTRIAEGDRLEILAPMQGG